MKATRFTIERYKWARGGRDPKIQLLNRDTQRMCCLGFYALACGIRPAFIEGLSEYYEIDDKVIGELPVELIQPPASDEYLWSQTRTHNDLMHVNDDDKLDDHERERHVAELFRKIGVEVEFVDGEQP